MGWVEWIGWMGEGGEARQPGPLEAPTHPPIHAHTDANFPAASIAHHTPGGLVNADGTCV